MMEGVLTLLPLCCRFFYQFLLANERTVAKEIRDEYVDTMSKIYYSYFKSYSGRLLKVQVRAPPSCHSTPRRGPPARH